MEYILNYLSSILFSKYTLFLVELICCLIKVGILGFIITQVAQQKKVQQTWIYLIVILTGSIIGDIAWLALLSPILVTLPLRAFIIRMSWTCVAFQYQTIGLFIESLVEQKHKITLRQLVYSAISITAASYFIFLAVFKFNEPAITSLEKSLRSFILVCMPYVFILPSLFIAIKKARYITSRILKQQLRLLIKYLVGPYLILEVFQGFFVIFKCPRLESFAATLLITPLLTFALYYSVRRIMRLRFLNARDHVQTATTKFNFIDDFKEVLEQLSHVVQVQEITSIVQNFFTQAFKIPAQRTSLHIRHLDAQTHTYLENVELSIRENIVEEFLRTREDADAPTAVALRTTRILITDEIVFSNFYEESAVRAEFLTFLNKINADIFLPIYEKHTIIGYIIVERNARAHEFYSDVERDEMLVFASYLANIVHLFQTKNIEALVLKEKALHDELFRKHQENMQYKESIRSFLRLQKQRIAGVVFYKQRRFIIGNKEAQDLIGINLNNYPGHSITKTFKQLAQQVADYRQPHTVCSKNTKGEKIVLYGIPQIEDNTIIILVSYPEISDVIRTQAEILHDPTAWDYLLYLETTKSGQLVNRLIPGNSNQLLQFKVNLLKLSLGKQALLLSMPEDDLVPTAEIIHHISLRETFHTLELTALAKTTEISVKLFGMNQLITKSAPALFEQLTNGTLFIKNVHFLPTDVQQRLAECLKYGFYNPLKSDQKIECSTRIICSTPYDLQTLVTEGRICTALAELLQTTTLVMPSLLTMPAYELSELTQEMADQALTNDTYKNLLELNERETEKLIRSRPVSLKELRNRIQLLLQNKAKKNAIAPEIHVDPAFHITDPALAEAARMGKKALRDNQTMALLWHRFKNQNKIATFLGVNRSSVYRRCKDFGLSS